MSNTLFSLLLAVYAREKPDNLDQCLASVEASTQRPDQLVLVEDGPLTPQLAEVIERYRKKLHIESVRLSQNRGRPLAFNSGLLKCTHEIVARLDSDDMCLPERFERQLLFLEAHQDVAAVGSAVQEFEPETGKLSGVRCVPTEHNELVKYAKLRCPLNQPAVMFRKSPVLAVGAYPIQYTVAFEDYALWVNLVLAGYKLANLPHVLVFMRAGAGQTERRRGLLYAKQEIAFAKNFRRAGFLNIWEYLRFILIRVPVRFFPKRLVRELYGFFRESSCRN